MKKFGVVWPHGKGDRHPKRQREAFESDGIEPEHIFDEDGLPNPRSDVMDVVIKHYLDPLGDDPKRKKPANFVFLAQRYWRLSGGGNRIVRVVENGQDYQGLKGLVQLIEDWGLSKRRLQTQEARARSMGRKAQAGPKFWLALDLAERRRLRKDFEDRSHGKSVKALAEEVGTTEATLYRHSRNMGWKNPSSFKGNQ